MSPGRSVFGPSAAGIGRREVRRHTDLDHFEIVGEFQDFVPDIWLLISAGTGLESDLAHVFELDASPAAQHKVHLELEVVCVVTAGLHRSNNMRENSAPRRVDGSEVLILEITAKPRFLFR